MFDFSKVLAATPNGVLTTCDGDALRSRVFQFLFAEDKKVFFCTSKEKDVYKQLTADPKVAFCAYPADFTPVVSISGQAVFVDDLKIKTRALDENPMIKDIYKTPDNPVFAIFYIDAKEVKTFSFTEGPKTYTF
ncbi:pyridoxamine 5-phosphate oxidase [Deltaproteobacteria bacterium Smac51]|nr:pyridoxamine 5-phosphate oxidase [Deltaproteobacteria bacterium Smac51]